MVKLDDLVSKFNPEINSFNPKNKEGSLDNINLSMELSPLTKLVINLYQGLLGNNIILNFSESYLRIIPLLSYIYADKFNKSVYVISLEKGVSYNNSNSNSINKNYHLLNNKSYHYLFYQVPFCYLKDLKLDILPYLPRATHYFKRKFNKKTYIRSKYPKIILETEKNIYKIKDKISKILLNNGKLENSQVDIGLIIIENADRFFNSKNKCLKLIEWIKSQSNPDLLILLHFSNLNYEFIELFQDELNFKIIPFNQSILKNNKPLIEKSLEYFKNTNETRGNILNKYNLDNKFNYLNDINIKIHSPLIKSGGMDYYFHLIRDILNKLKTDSIYNKIYFYKSINLFHSLDNLSINPSFLKIKIKIEENWFYFSVPEFIEIFQEKLRTENKHNRFLLNNYLILLNNLYLELSRCKRFNEKTSYNRIGKDYELLNVIKKITKDNEVIIGTYFSTEPKILEEQIKNKLPQCVEKVTPIFMGNLNRESEDTKINKILILPGVIPEYYISEIYKPYKEIIILSYEGFNNRLINQQLNTLTGNLIDQESISMNYLKEIFEDLEIDLNNNFFEDFNIRYEKTEILKEEENKKINEHEEKHTLKEGNETLDSFKSSFQDSKTNFKESKNNIPFNNLEKDSNGYIFNKNLKGQYIPLNLSENDIHLIFMEYINNKSIKSLSTQFNINFNDMERIINRILARDFKTIPFIKSKSFNKEISILNQNENNTSKDTEKTIKLNEINEKINFITNYYDNILAKESKNTEITKKSKSKELNKKLIKSNKQINLINNLDNSKNKKPLFKLEEEKQTEINTLTNINEPKNFIEEIEELKNQVRKLNNINKEKSDKINRLILENQNTTDMFNKKINDLNDSFEDFNELKNNINLLTSENINLKTFNKEKSDENEKLIKENNKYIFECNDNINELNDYRFKFDDLNSQIKILKRENSNLKAFDEIKSDKIDSLVVENQKASNMYNQKIKKLNDSLEKYYQLSNEVEDLKNEIPSLIKVNKEKSNQINDLIIKNKKSSEEYYQKISNLNDSLAEYDQIKIENEDLKQINKIKSEELNKLVETNKKSKQEYTQKIEDLKSSITNQEQNNDLKSEINILKSENANLKTFNKNKSKELELEQNKIKKINNELQNNEKDYNKLKSSFNNKINDLNKEFDELNSGKSSLKTYNDNFDYNDEEGLNHLIGKISKVKFELNDLKKSNSELLKENDKLKSELKLKPKEDLTSEIESLKLQIKHMKTVYKENKDLNKKINDLKADKTSSSDYVEVDSNNNYSSNILRDQLSKAKLNLNEIKKSNSELLAENERLKSELKLKPKDRLTFEIESLKLQIKDMENVYNRNIELNNEIYDLKRGQTYLINHDKLDYSSNNDSNILKDQLSKAKLELNELKNDTYQLNKDIEELNAEKKTIKNDADSLIQSHEERIDSLKENLSDVKFELYELKKSNQQLIDENEKLKSDINSKHENKRNYKPQTNFKNTKKNLENLGREMRNIDDFTYKFINGKIKKIKK